MAPKSSNGSSFIIDDITSPIDDDDKFGLQQTLSKPARRLRRKPQTKTIQKFVKQHADNFKQEDHDVQLVLEIKTLEGGEEKTRTYNTTVFNVFGGKYKLRKGIEGKTKEIKSHIDNDYNKELLDINILRIYIDNVKRNIQDFGDIKMFGTLLNLCGYELNIGKYEFINACCVEYHVKMFNKFRDNKWTIERFMTEIGMNSIDEGVCLNQLIPFVYQIQNWISCCRF